MNLGVGTVQPYAGSESLVLSEPRGCRQWEEAQGKWAWEQNPRSEEREAPGMLPAVVAIQTRL